MEILMAGKEYLEEDKRTEELQDEIKQNIKLHKYEITNKCMELLHTLWDDSEEDYYQELYNEHVRIILKEIYSLKRKSIQNIKEKEEEEINEKRKRKKEIQEKKEKREQIEEEINSFLVITSILKYHKEYIKRKEIQEINKKIQEDIIPYIIVENEMKDKEIKIIMRYMKKYFTIFNEIYKEYAMKRIEFIQTVHQLSQSQHQISMSQELYSQREEIKREEEEMKRMINENKEYFEFVKRFIINEKEKEENDIINKNENKMKGEMIELVLKLVEMKEYNMMINQYEYYLIINEMKQHKEIINDILIILNKKLKKMSLRYYILPAILSSYSTKIYSKCKMILLRNCQIRREFIKHNIEKIKEEEIYALLPEYSIQHLIHYYGYNEEFRTETIDEMSKIMMFMIENIIENNSEGISIIQHQLEIIKMSNDNLFESLRLK
jgi:hypothetical protein